MKTFLVAAILSLIEAQKQEIQLIEPDDEGHEMSGTYWIEKDRASGDKFFVI
jgi:hypothetical protein